MLLTGHSGEVESDRLAAWLEKAAGPGDVTVEALALDARSGVELHLGASVRWVRRAMSA